MRKKNVNQTEGPGNFQQCFPYCYDLEIPERPSSKKKMPVARGGGEREQEEDCLLIPVIIIQVGFYRDEHAYGVFIPHNSHLRPTIPNERPRSEETTE